MSPKLIAILATVALSAVGVLGDYFLKLASKSSSPMTNGYFVLGFVIYSSTAIGWVYVMRELPLAYIGVFYSVSIILFLCVVGFVFFQETLKPAEILGVGLAIASLLLLSRVA